VQSVRDEYYDHQKVAQFGERFRGLYTYGSGQGDWGSLRAALVPDRGTSGPNYQGLFIHGKLNEVDFTHGCICNRTENVLGALWKEVKAPVVPVWVK
jgi:hypothetical protein